MRLLYIANEYPAVSETFVSDQVEYLRNSGHDISVISVRNREDLDFVDAVFSKKGPMEVACSVVSGVIATLSAPSKYIELFNIAKVLRHRIIYPLAMIGRVRRRRREYDGLVCHFGEIGLWGRLVSSYALQCPVQVTVFHGYDLSAMVRRRGVKLYRSLFGYDHKSVSISQTWLPVLSILGDAQARVIRLGVSLDKFAFRQRTKVSDRPIRFVTVARLVQKKGHDLVLRALSRLPHADWTYWVVGDGPEAEPLIRLAKDMDLSEKVFFLGKKTHKEVEEILGEADCFVLPSRTGQDGDMEGIPVALMEAMASGLMVVSSRHSGIVDLIDDGRTGYLISEENVDDLEAALSKVIQGDTWHEVSTAARRKIEADFDLERNSREFERYVEAAIGHAVDCH